MIENITPVSYVAVSILFILSLGGLASQKRAKVGNIFGMIGMGIALAATFLDREHFQGYGTFWVCVVPGCAVGFYVAAKVVMTAMPQLVACLHSFVGLAAVLVGIANFLREGHLHEFTKQQVLIDIETFLGVFIGAITFTGSIVAFGKLQGVIRSNPLIIGGWFRHVLNAGCCAVCIIALFVYSAMWSHFAVRFWLLIANTLIAFFVGWHLVMAIGGADMPVVVSMLNSYSGWATAAAGFMLNNDAMIVTGSLVGSSGAILSYIMCFPAECTRVLTNHGFLFLDEIEELNKTHGDVLYAAYDRKTDSLVYRPGRLVYPDNRIEADHEFVDFTSMEEKHQWDSTATQTDAQSNHLSLLVTPEHRMFVATGRRRYSNGARASATWDDPEVYAARELLSSCHCGESSCASCRRCLRFKACTSGLGAPDMAVVSTALAPLELTSAAQVCAFLKVFGFWLGDGTMLYDKNGTGYVTFVQRKPGDIQWLKKELPKAGLKASDWHTYPGDAGLTVFRIKASRWNNWFHNAYGIKYRTSPTYDPSFASSKSAKWFPEWTFKCSPSQLRNIVEGLHLADGSKGNKTIFTSSLKFRDQLSVILLHAGYTTFFRLGYAKGTVRPLYDKYTGTTRELVAKSDAWAVQWAEPMGTRAMSACAPSIDADEVTSTKRRGVIWCVEVDHPDHLIVAQRAERDADGIVRKASRPVVVGQCAAMNRSFISVILGGFGGEVAAPVAAAKDGEAAPREVVATNAKELVQLLIDAKEIVIIPGYGLAVARGQHAIASITEILRAMGKRVRFAIHPVAGRLPGHMNVLLAEANVPYDIVLEMDEINPDMPTTDVSIVVGANDIVNPIALTDPTCAIAGMPIIECFRSKVCVVNKRSMASGYAGIDNPLFYYENTRMLFGDSKKAFEEVLGELQKRKSEIKAADISDKTSEKSHLMADHVEKITPEDLPPVFCVIGVPREVAPLERMVAITPQTALVLRKKGFGIIVESGAGDMASMPDSEYEKVLCQVVPDAREVYKMANVIAKVQPPVPSHPTLRVPEVSLLREGQTLISFLYPARNAEILSQLNAAKVTALAMDMVPRITRAQKLDALSSLSNLAGYRGVIEASHAFGRVFTGQITAAGKLPPATVFIIGAGVAGLAAIGTAKNLGAVVKAFDTRKSVKEQIESMGGEFLPVPIDEDAEDASGYAKQISAAFIKAELELFARTCPVVDIIITTAAIPGRKAPILITEDMVASMKPGSVIVDLAAGTGGNCEVTRVGETYQYKGVTIVGNSDLVARMAPQASQLYSQNIVNLLDMLVDKSKRYSVNLEDEVVRQMCICKDGTVQYPPPKIAVSAAAPSAKKPEPPKTSIVEEKKETGFTTTSYVYIGLIMTLLVAMIWFVPSGFITHFMDFVLAVIVGYHVIWSVTPALHTPLMSETNAISGIIAVGGMLCLGKFGDWSAAALLGGVATTLATINIAGGFFITYRMLLMFHD